MEARELIARKLQGLPDQPGVYLWKSAAGEILYVGKAKSLRARVPSYFGPEAESTPERAALVRQIADLETIVVPSSFAFVALGPVIVGALFQTGRFAASDTELVGGVLAAYGVGLLGQATVKLFASGFYALRDTRTPVKIAASSLLLSTALAALLMRRFGPAGVALGSSLGAWVNVVLHLRDLDARIGAVLGRGEWRQSWDGNAPGFAPGVSALR